MSERRFPSPAPSRTSYTENGGGEKSRKNQEFERTTPAGDEDSRSDARSGGNREKYTAKNKPGNRGGYSGNRPGQRPNDHRGDRPGGRFGDRAGLGRGYTHPGPDERMPEEDAPRAGHGPANQAEGGEEDRTLQPGMKPVLELLESDPSRVDAVFIRKGRRDKNTDRILDLCRAAGVRFSLVDDTFLSRLWPGNHQGAIARLFAAGFTDIQSALESACDAPLPLLLAFDQVQDPGNAGAMARTLYALGGAGIILPRHNGVYLGAAAAKASAGALEHLSVVKAGNLGQALDVAEKAGFTIYGASSSSSGTVPLEDVFDFTPDFPAVLVLGGEEGGLRPSIASRCSALVRIPLARDFDSLNVAQAGAILMARFAAARTKKA